MSMAFARTATNLQAYVHGCFLIWDTPQLKEHGRLLFVEQLLRCEAWHARFRVTGLGGCCFYLDIG